MSQRILIVDDEESIRFTFSEFLGEAGYQVDRAENFAQAAAFFEAREYDAIFLDILLGRESGIDILQAAKQANPNCPVTMVTGAPEIKTAAAAVRLGAFDYLTKPVSQAELLRQAERAVAYKTALAEKRRYQQRLSAVFEGVREGILVFDAGLRLLEMNFAAGRMLGCGEEVLGQQLDAIIGATGNPVLKALHELLEARFDGELYRLTVAVPGGETIILGVSVSPLTSAKGHDADLVLVLRDESARATPLEVAG